MSNNPDTLAPLINKLDQANNELTFDIQRENDEEINYDMSLFGRITKPINPNYHQESSDTILNDVLHSMSILSKPGDEGMFNFNEEELNLVSKIKIVVAILILT